MIYMRGHTQDYDGWDLPGWSYREVLPLFKRLETHTPTLERKSAYHGYGGPLHIETRRYSNPLSEAFVQAGQAVGLAHNPDFNGESQDGVGLYEVFHKGGRRWSSADAYLRPALGRPNLTVHTHARTRRLTLARGRVTGVEYFRAGKLERATATRGVVLCAGAIGSPQILMLSGIGPAAQLERVGVPVLHALPGVGQNLQDHLACPLPIRCTQPVSLEGVETLPNLARALIGQGPLVSNIAEAGGFVRQGPGGTAPDLQFHFGPAYFVAHGFERAEGHHFTLGPTLLQPEARGFVRLRSGDPFQDPEIQPCYGAEADLERLVDGLLLAREIAASRPFDPFRGAEALTEGLRSREDLRGHVRRHVETLYHPVGTCRMGSGEDAVVDPQLRVRGLEGLFVADASVMPRIIRGNTHAPSVMIGEKLAELLIG